MKSSGSPDLSMAKTFVPYRLATSSCGLTPISAITATTPEKRAANDLNGAISLKQAFNRIFQKFCNRQYFGVYKAKYGDRGTIVYSAALRHNTYFFALDNMGHPCGRIFDSFRGYGIFFSKKQYKASSFPAIQSLLHADKTWSLKWKPGTLMRQGNFMESLWSGKGLIRERWCCDHTSQIHGTLFYYCFFVPHIMGIHSPLVTDNHNNTHNQLTQHAELVGSTKIRSRVLSNISPEK